MLDYIIDMLIIWVTTYAWLCYLTWEIKHYSRKSNNLKWYEKDLF